MPLRDRVAHVRPGHSLGWRLPAAIALLIGIVLFTYVWVGQALLERTLADAGSQRLKTAAQVLARLLDRTAALAQIRKSAASPELIAYLGDPAPERAAAAREALRLLSFTQARRVELWDRRGNRVLDFTRTGPPEVPPIDRVPPEGVSPLAATNGIVHYDFSVPIQDGLGHIVVRTAFTPANPEAISRLVGQYALALIGNRDGTVWFDLTRPVPGPALRADREGVFEFQDAAGDTFVGSAVFIGAAPWVAWVQFPREQLVLPGAAFWRQMVPMAVLFLLIGAGLVWATTTRITRPLAALSAAAGAVAAGDFSQRIQVGSRDEVGLLADSFNVMTSVIQESRLRLEARVAERTAELAAARAEADAANRAKSEFLSLMSHDLRTPLNAILGFAQLLEHEDLTPEQAEHVGHILSGGRHLLALISDVLDITRIESGQLGLSVEAIPVRELVLEKAALVRPLAQQRGITVTVDDVFGDATVKGDRQRLSQVLLNLLSNAVKYNRPKGAVTISGAGVGAGRYRITVTDTGIGLTDAQRSRLFRPFERLGAEQTAVEGTGLGLALSRALAAAMGGSLGLTSTPGAGSTFWVELPEAGTLPHAEPVTTPDTLHVPATQGGVILYVEDNLPNVKLLQRILQKRAGVRLLHASTGAEGLEMARAVRPGLMLLDLHLPDMRGERVLNELTSDARTRDVPKVVVTADATPGLARRLESKGAIACLTKPLNIGDVLRLVDRLLRPAHGEPIDA